MKKLEQALSYSFKNPALLERALTHSSYLNEHGLKKTDCYERLEFLGDAVLEMVSSEFLYENYPDLPEGELSKLRASLVCEPSLAVSARALHIGDYLILGKGMEMNGGRFSESVLSDVFEAVIAAIYLDSGLPAAKKLILDYVLNDIQDKILYFDAKTTLQEMVQSKGLTVEYRIIGEHGPEHAKEFSAGAYVKNTLCGTGKGHNKKQAEQSAAFETIKMIRNNDLCI